MTREEARKILENLKEHTLNYQSGLALDMAISALSAIEDIKAEIEEKISHYDHFQGSNTAHGLEIALEIIDKHIEGDKE